MKRLDGWPTRLDAEIEAALARPFRWGTHDCALFVADVVRAMTGADPAVSYRGRYKTKRGAYSMLKRRHGGGLTEFAAELASDLECPEIPPLTARRGDVMLVDSDEGPALGICAGAHVAVAAKEIGLIFMPMVSARRAWRV